MAHPTAHHILFVGHEATQTGASIELLHLLRWLRKNETCRFSILMGRGGELMSSFEELADTWSLDRSRWRRDALRSRLLFRARMGQWASRAKAREVHRFVFRDHPALVYVNTIASANAIETLPPGIPIVTHVHELEYAFSTRTGPALSRLLADTHHFIAGSNAVKKNLISSHDIPASRIQTIHESIPVDDVRAERTREQVVRELHMPADTLLVIGSGSAGWGKGTDLFIQLARLICQRRADVNFIWVGACPWGQAYFEHDLRITGLTEKVRFTGPVSNPADYVAAGDIFVLTSREDSYPLVCLEAAALAKPIVCFADAGGTPEFVEDDCGFVVPYLDIVAMVERILYLFDSSQCRLKMGTAAREKVVQRHDVDKAAPLIMQLIERVIEAGEKNAIHAR